MILICSTPECTRTAMLARTICVPRVYAAMSARAATAPPPRPRQYKSAEDDIGELLSGEGPP